MVNRFVILTVLPALLLFVLVQSVHPAPRAPGDDSVNEAGLLKLLKNARTGKDRQESLTRLYRFYKDKKTDYLERSYLLKLIDVQKSNGDIAGLESAYLDLGDIYRRRNDYLAALTNYFKGLRYSGKLTDNRAGYIYLQVAGVFRVLNRGQLVRKYLKMALDYSGKYKDPKLKVLVLNTYSQLFYDEEDYAGALKYIDLSIETERQLKTYVCGVSSLYRKAMILIKLQDGKTLKKNVMPLLDTAVTNGLSLGKYDDLLPIMTEYIERLTAQHRHLEAARLLDRIDEIYAPYYTYYFFYYYLRAIFSENQGMMDAASQYYSKTADALAAYFSGLQAHHYQVHREKISQIYAQIIRFYLDMFDRSLDTGYLRKAMFYSEIKNAYIYEPVTTKNRGGAYLPEEKKKLEQEFLEYNQKYLQLVKSPDNIWKTFRVKLYETRLASLKMQVQELEEFILESPIAYKSYRFNDFRLHGIRAKLTAGQMIIKYSVLKDSIYVFGIERSGIRYWRLPGSARETIGYVKRLTEPLDDFTEGRVDYLHINYDLQLAAKLYDILLRDILETRSGRAAGEIIIIPDRELFKVPFEALVTGFKDVPMAADVIFSEYASARYLVETYPVSYALSLFHFLKKPAATRTNRRYFVTAFGDPVIKNPGNSTANNNGEWSALLFRELPSSRQEVLEVGSIFGPGKSRVFLKEDFSLKNFERFAPQSRLVHIATHFVGNAHYPQYSALLFSPGKSNAPLYHAHQVFKMKLGAELVVLSACESSEKHLLGFQGLSGMTASFRRAGARAMIMSMWPVDQHSSRLTPLFYRQYKTPGNGAARALRTARLQMMEQTVTLENGLKISYAHPFIWANYILYYFVY